MSNFFKIETKKLFKRKEIIILFLLLILPFLLTLFFLNSPDTYKIDYNFGDGRIPILSYPTLMLGFFLNLGVFPLIFSVLSNSISTERESNYISLYFVGVKDKGKIYLGKMCSLIFVLLVWIIFYVFSSLLSYLLFNFGGENIANMHLLDEGVAYWILMLIVIFFELIAIINITLCLSTFLSTNTLLITNIVIVSITIMFNNIPIIKYLLPSYYRQEAINSMDISNPNYLIFGFLSILASIIVSIICYKLGKHKFNSSGGKGVR